MSKAKNPKALSVVRGPDQSDAQSIAMAALNPAINAATVVDSYQANIMGKDVDLDAMVETLQSSMDKSKAGDLSELEAMLIGQATALQTIFVSLANRAHHQQYQKHLEGFLGLALKAQAQSRATISALVELKYPRQATFVKQANIAHGPQQVNNGLPEQYAQAHAVKSVAEQNQLSEDSHGSSYLHTGAVPTAAQSNSAMEAVEQAHRAEKPRR